MPKLPDDTPATTPGAERPRKQQPRKTATKPEKARITLLLPVALAERMRNAVYNLQGTSMTGFTELAIVRELNRQERKHGGPFPERKGKPPAGPRKHVGPLPERKGKAPTGPRIIAVVRAH